MKNLSKKKSKKALELKRVQPRKLSESALRCIVLTDLSEIKTFLNKLDSNEIGFWIFDENFSFFRALEKGFWDLVIIDSGVWSYLPRETRKRFFEFQNNQGNNQGKNQGSKIIYLETEKELNDKKIKKNFIYLNKEASQESVMTSEAHIKILFHQILFWSLGEEYILKSLESTKDDIRHRSLEKLIPYLKRIDCPFPILAGNSEEKESLEEQFEQARHTNSSLLIAGNRGSLTNEFGYLIHLWRRSSGKNYIEIDINQNPKPPFSTKELKFAELKTILLKMNDTLAQDSSYQWIQLFKNTDLEKTKIIWTFESNSSQQISRFRKSINVIENIQIPPLSTRILDIPSIVQVYFSMLTDTEVEISKSVLSNLLKQQWSYNYEQLKQQVLTWLVPYRKKIKIPDLPSFMISLDKGWHETIRTLPFPKEGISLEKIEKELLERALKETNYSIAKSARLLNIGRKAFLYRMKKFKISNKKDNKKEE